MAPNETVQWPRETPLLTFSSNEIT